MSSTWSQVGTSRSTGLPGIFCETKRSMLLSYPLFHECDTKGIRGTSPGFSRINLGPRSAVAAHSRRTPKETFFFSLRRLPNHNSCWNTY